MMIIMIMVLIIIMMIMMMIIIMIMVMIILMIPLGGAGGLTWGLNSYISLRPSPQCPVNSSYHPLYGSHHCQIHVLAYARLLDLGLRVRLHVRWREISLELINNNELKSIDKTIIAC
jgi:hypothetical protein